MLSQAGAWDKDNPVTTRDLVSLRRLTVLYMIMNQTISIFSKAFKILIGIFCLTMINNAMVAANNHSMALAPHLKVHQQSSNPPLNLLQYVNILQGTNSKFSFSHGNIYPIIGLPHGMNYWAPQTGKNGDGWKYQYNAQTIRGFDDAHQAYVWGGSAPGVFSIMPESGKLVFNESKRAAFFSHSQEVGKPNYYKVTFKNGITTQLAPTERGAFFQFSFPSSQKSYVILDGYTRKSKINIYPKQRKITGWVNNGHSSFNKNFKNYFVLQFSQPFVSYGTWQNVTDSGIAKGGTSDQGKGVGAYIQFKKGATVQVKVASSYISIDQAEVTLHRELGQYSTINQAKKAAGKVWNRLLNRIVVTGGSKAQKEIFYSCLYRSNLFPMKEYELDKNGKPRYYGLSDGSIYKGYHYKSPNFWDTYRSLFPLQNILNPTFQRRYMKSLMDSYKHRGRSQGGGMIGNHVISVLADAWAKGIHSFNPDSALAYYYHAVTHTSARPGHKDYFKLGYIPYPQGTLRNYESTARTLAYAYDDYCAYKLAKMAHNSHYEKFFAGSMYNYKNVFNPRTNFMEGKDAHGNWDKKFNPYRWGGPFTEGDSWQWTWAVPQDVQGLINLMGGNKAFNTKLDSLFTAPSDSVLVGGYGFGIHEINEMVFEKMGQYAGGNEPGFQIGYLYDYAGQPWKTQKHVRAMMTKLFSAGPDGFPGDQDAGATSSWYVLGALGFYSVTTGTNQYAIGSPLFKKAVITLKSGKKFVIKADNNGPSNVYIQSAVLNGKRYSRNWITYKDITDGGTLHFRMGSQPNKQRGVGKRDAPFSLSKKSKND
jgi:predicted alpha-1,2-mannosidase